MPMLRIRRLTPRDGIATDTFEGSPAQSDAFSHVAPVAYGSLVSLIDAEHGPLREAMCRERWRTPA